MTLNKRNCPQDASVNDNEVARLPCVEDDARANADVDLNDAGIGINAPGVRGLSSSRFSNSSKFFDSTIPRSMTELMTSSTWLSLRERSSILSCAA